MYKFALSGEVTFTNQTNFLGVCLLELHSQLVAVETEMNTKHKEFQTLHNSLTDAIVSKEKLEQRVMELLEASQHSLPEDAMQVQVRHAASVRFYQAEMETHIFSYIELAVQMH